MKYQDIHLEDKAAWDNLKAYIAAGNYAAVKALIETTALKGKVVNAEMFNTICTELTQLQTQQDTSFKADKIKMAKTPPDGIVVGQVYFHINE